VKVLQRADDESVVGENRLPGKRPNEIRHEERRDDEQQQQVLPAAAPERDPVCDGITEHEGEQRRDPGVLEGPDELRAVVAKGIPVVAPRPREGVTDVEVPRLQRLVCQKAERDHEEDAQPQDAGCEQQVRRQAAVPVEKFHAMPR
jgi:hypothetical protein